MAKVSLTSDAVPAHQRNCIAQLFENHFQKLHVLAPSLICVGRTTVSSREIPHHPAPVIDRTLLVTAAEGAVEGSSEPPIKKLRSSCLSSVH